MEMTDKEIDEILYDGYSEEDMQSEGLEYDIRDML